MIQGLVLVVARIYVIVTRRRRRLRLPPRVPAADVPGRTARSTSSREALPEDAAAEKLTSLSAPTRLPMVLRPRLAIVGLAFLAFLVLVALFSPSSPIPTTRTCRCHRRGGKGAKPPAALRASTSSAARRPGPSASSACDGNAQDVEGRGQSPGPASALWIGFVTVGVAIIIGIDHRGHRQVLRPPTDNVLMRLMDVVLAFPSLLLAIAIVDRPRPEPRRRTAGSRQSSAIPVYTPGP